MKETVVHIKESIELVRRWRYVTSKDESLFHEQQYTCYYGCHKSGPKPHWEYKLIYDEERRKETRKVNKYEKK